VYVPHTNSHLVLLFDALVAKRAQAALDRIDMALLLRRVTSVAAKRAAACALADNAACAGARGFASKKDKQKGKRGDDGNFDQMLRAIKGQYPDAYVSF
jgi:hypothetical protein